MKWASEIVVPSGMALAALLAGVLGLRFRIWPAASAVLGIMGTSLLILSLIFFRNPKRVSDAPPEHILAPADGVVVAVQPVQETRYLGGASIRIGIFMHLGNVHVQHLPADGTLTWAEHHPGKFRPAYDKLAARDNEQRWYGFESARGRFAVVQIAGLIARRTIPWIRVGDTRSRGAELGMIAFGSEVDVYLPASSRVFVKTGERVLAGTTVIAAWSDTQ